MSKSKRRKTDRHRQVRGPAATRKPEDTARSREQHTCFPRQLPRLPHVHRAKPEVIDGRMYPATARVRLDNGERAQFDLLGTLYALATGELTGECADIVAALAFVYMEQAPLPIPEREALTSPAAMVDSFRRLIADGFIGRDENGGYLTATPLDAVPARRPPHLCPPA
ncbi:hypothetical protein ABT187_43210 [Streptomyces sp. NPDC001817]|uniref:hypothetical protein n=1 Tax=Streptomyces sp. NPDC001817 TaxID=3154398 RepID=UPI00331E32EA